MEKKADLYTFLTGKSKDALGNISGVKSVVKEFIVGSSTPASILKDMRPVYLDGANLVKPKEKPKRKAKNRPLNARERRQLKVYDIDKTYIKYDLFLPLHQLWQGYMKDVWESSRGGTESQAVQQFAQRLLRADLHGSILTVTKSKNPLFIGTTGIMIQETMNVFSIVTKDNKLKKVPKAGTIFLLKTDACKQSFTLYGQQLQFRAAERAAKKFKVKSSIDL
ncbi:Rof/RNase P-like protein [Halteromyces radiatus]|uniref:Rof/RNase P-like protein n=1 Tax=Halteromyces radiatus TaxID=101107 RepID=UPI00221EC6EB|nr:Rof/RNase P-like protein [Halteromyces radiatus]KAI8092458.1 Rof/RNase P-like protein [Halteromyces radiatus]